MVTRTAGVGSRIGAAQRPPYTLGRSTAFRGSKPREDAHGRGMSPYPRWKPYVPVARRRAAAVAYARKLAKREKRSLEPIQLTGKTISTTFWGQAWCENLE